MARDYTLKPLSQCRRPIQRRAKSMRRSADDNDDDAADEKSVKRYINDIRWFDGWLDEQYIGDIEDVTPADAHTLGETLNDEFNGSTGVNRWNEIYKLYQFLYRIEKIEQNPLEKWDDIKKKEFGLTKSTEQSKHVDDGTGYALSPSEVRTLEQHIEEHQTRNRLLVRLLWQTGMRRGEAANLDLSDVDRDRREVTVREEFAKNGERRVVPFQQSLDKLLDKWLEIERSRYTGSPDCKSLFVGERGGNFTGEAVNKVVVKASKRAGMNEVMYTDAKGANRWKITAHSLRIGFGTYLANETDIDIYKLSKLMGHKSVEITETRYVSPDDRTGVEAGRRYGPD